MFCACVPVCVCLIVCLPFFKENDFYKNCYDHYGTGGYRKLIYYYFG